MNRSGFFQRLAVVAAGTSIFPRETLVAGSGSRSSSDVFYVGCYTAGPEEGIPVCSFDPGTGSMEIREITKRVDSPSFLIGAPGGKVVYAANETDNFGGRTTGAVSSFLREAGGKLTHLNTQPSQGAHPCHLTLDRTGRFLLVANYTGGNAAVFPVSPDGRIGESCDRVQHQGSGPNKSRQEAPHVHSVNMSPDNRFAIICDLGIDRIMIYRFDDRNGKLKPAETPYFQAAPGSGPRHFTFSPDGKLAFTVNELNSTLTSLHWDAGKGFLREIHTVTTLPAGFTGENTCADVHVHPNGRFVFASNRGDDSIAVFGINHIDGRLTLIQHQPTGGKTPRNFAIHSSGRWLLAANQNSNSIHSFSLDPATGRLTATGKSITINKPVCLLF